MEFLNPAGLYTLFLLPLLLIPYLFRRRRRLVFSSLLLLTEFSMGSSGRSWARLRLPLLFFLQLLFLGVLVLGLGDLVVTMRPPENLAIVLDNSASMQTREGEKSRFEVAKGKARELLGSLTPGTRVSLLLTLPRLQPIGEDLSPGEALDLMEPLSPYDLGEPQGEYGRFLFRLSKDSKYDRIVFLTDYQVREPGGSIDVISVGQPQRNIAITSFVLTRSFASDQLQGRVEVTNFDFKEQRVQLSLKGEGRNLSSRTLTVAARKSAMVYFEGFPPRSYYAAELQIRDALALDNVRYAVSPALKGLSVLGISPRPDELRSLRAIPGLTLKFILPDAYQETVGKDQALEIFHFSAPQVLPRNDALFVLPPEGNPLVTLERPRSQPSISGWRDPHPLTRYVNFALFRPPYTRPVIPPPLAEKIIEGPGGPLAVIVKQHGFQYLVLGFDPFPYLAQDNLPMSIFTLNLLSWFYEGRGGSATGTGEPLRLRSYEGWSLVTPKGETVNIGKGSDFFSRTFFQGIYRVVKGADEKFLVVNFDEVGESDMAQLSSLNLKQIAGLAVVRSHMLSLWFYLVLASLLLLFLEWFLNPPAARPRFSITHGPGEHRV